MLSNGQIHSLELQARQAWQNSGGGGGLQRGSQDLTKGGGG